DLDRFLGGEPIRARPADVLRRTWAWTRKRPWVLTGAASLLTIVTLCLSYGLWTRACEGDWEALYLKAKVTRLGGKPDQAIEQLQEAARLRPDRRLYDEAALALHASGTIGRRLSLLPQTEQELGRDPEYTWDLRFAASQDGRLLLLPGDGFQYFV